MLFLIVFFPALLSLYISYRILGKKFDKKNKVEIIKQYLFYFFLLNYIYIFLCLILSRDLFTLSFQLPIKFTMITLVIQTLLSILLPYLFEKKLNKYKIDVLSFALIFVLFYMYDFFVRHLIGKKEVLVWQYTSLSPELFTFAFIFVFILIIYIFKKKRLIFNIFNIICFILFISQYFHFMILDRAYNFYDIFTASEGLHYLNFLVEAIDKELLILTVFMILTSIFINILLKKINIVKLSKKRIYSYFLFFLIPMLLIVVAYFLLGKKNELTFFADATTPKNIFTDFDNTNRSLKVSGLYLYNVKNIYIFVKDNFFKEDTTNLKKEFNEELKNMKYKHIGNEESGILKGKSVVYILLESVDGAFINEDTTPTIYKMQEEGYDFTNRYAPNYGTGRTFDAEFSINTALHQPINGNASLKLVNNYFKYSVANIFNNAGYETSSWHQNSGSFYHRDTFHKNLGYKEINMDLNKKYDSNFVYDSNLIKNQDVFNKLVSGEKFFDFIITYSGHGPYTKMDVYCEKFLDKYPEFRNDGEYELQCLNAKLRETDKFLEEFVEKLKENKKLNDVVFVLITDHHAYNYTKINEVRKEDDVNLISKTPFIIYNPELKAKKIDTVMGTYDILPTVANMLGVEYNPVFSVGTDVFDKTHKNFVYFLDNTWINNDGIYSKELKKCDDNCERINKKVLKYVKLNELILKSNYYE